MKLILIKIRDALKLMIPDLCSAILTGLMVAFLFNLN